MNYEERYKRALKRARIGLHDCNLLNCDDMTKRAAITTIYHLFPELAEDEDERIRKGIIRNLQYLMDRSEGFVKEDLQERIAWLEKQGESTITNIEIPFGANDSELQEVSYDIPKGFNAEIKDGRVVIKKTGPKFHEGDWIISNSKKLIYQVIEVKRGIYVIRDNVDNHEYHIGIEECEKSGRLWDIGQDANDGDVLATENFIFIFKNIDDGNGVHYYCQYEINKREDDNQFDIALPQSLMGRVGNSISHYSPATKEQSETLFKAMHEAGYTFGFEKKELKKIEHKALNADDVIEWLKSKVYDDSAYGMAMIEQFKKDFEI